jgi:5'-nucleotidase
MQLDDARGFVFDLDGTLVRRSPSGAEPMPGAREVLAALRASGRPFVVFTNASHVAPGVIARGVRAGGLEIGDDEVLTPVCSAIGHLRRERPGQRVLILGTTATKERILDAGIRVAEPGEEASADAVLVFHVDEIDLGVLEAAAHAIIAGAAFLTGNYAPAYAGADGPILSRGAMVAAAIAKVSAQEPIVVGKPSVAAVTEFSERLGLAPEDVAVVGDDLAMDIALGRVGGSRTVLVLSGIDGSGHAALPPEQRPDLVLHGIGDLLALL